MRVLLVAPLEKPGLTGGQARAARLVVDSLSRRIDVELVHVVHPHREEARTLIQALLFRLHFYVSFVLALVRRRPTIVHVFAPCSVRAVVEKTLMSLVARVFGARTLFNLRNDPRPMFEAARPQKRLLLGWCVRRFDGVLCQFSALREFYAARIGVAPERVFVAHNAIAGVAHSPELGTIRERLAMRRVVYLGSLQPRKGIEVLLDAVGRLEPARRPIVDIVGDPQPADYLEALRVRAQALGLATKVIFHGPRFGREKIALMDAAAVLVLPSRAEGFPNVVLEAGQLGLPVILTRIGAAEDIAEAYGAGALLFEVDDVMSLTEALEKVLGAHEQAYFVRSAAAAKGAGHFTVERMCAELVAAYSAIRTLPRNAVWR